MSAGNKCSLILMWDDGRTRRVRLRLGWLRIIAVLWIGLVAAGGAGIWLGWKAFRHIRVWEDERRHLEQELAEKRVRLERLANMEALYLGTLPAPAADSPQPSASATSEPAPPVEQAPASDPAGTTGLPAGSDAPASSDTAARAPSAEPASDTPLPASASVPPPAASDTLSAEQENTAVNTGVVRVENVRARIDERRFRISIDLYNGDSEGRQISGKALITLIDADGRTLPVVSDNMLFRIVRFKKLAAAVPLPAAQADTVNAVVRVEVYVNDKLEYRNTFPVESR